MYIRQSLGDMTIHINFVFCYRKIGTCVLLKGFGDDDNKHSMIG